MPTQYELYFAPHMREEVRTLMYFFLTEEYDRTLSPLRNKNGNAVFQTVEQSWKSRNYCAELSRRLAIHQLDAKMKSKLGLLSHKGLTDHLLSQQDTVREIEEFFYRHHGFELHDWDGGRRMSAHESCFFKHK